MVNMYLQVPTCNFTCISPFLSLPLQGCSFIIISFAIIIKSGSLHLHLLEQPVSIRTHHKRGNFVDLLGWT